MRRKFKLLIGGGITFIVVAALILILLSLDRLEVQYYGLNYNYITANFSDNSIYESGLHFIGVSNVLLQVVKIPQMINLPNLQTFSSDFYPLTISVSLTYVLNLPVNGSFDFLRNFYIDFGKNPQEILRPLIANQIITIASSHACSFYQNPSNSLNNSVSILQSQINTSISTQLKTWTDMSFQVLVQSVVCKGYSRNTQAIDKKIESLTAKYSRVDQESIEMTSLFNSSKLKYQNQIDRIYNALLRKTNQISEAINSNINSRSAKVLFGTEVTFRNLPFSSSALQLRPQLFMLNQSQF